MKQKPIQHERQFVIVANGEFLRSEVLRSILAGKHVLALDGAIDRLMQLGIVPHTLLGDFDSIVSHARWGLESDFADIDHDSESYIGKYGIHIVPAKDQSRTDLQKGIDYCDSQQAKCIDIICATSGDRMDHVLCNLRTLKSRYQSSRPLLIHTNTETIQFVCDDSCDIVGEVGDKCGIFAFPEASFSSSGLRWNGDNTPLKFAFSDSACNELTSRNARIAIQGEALLISPRLN